MLPNLIDFYSSECSECSDNIVIIPETLERCDKDFEGIDLILNEKIIIPAAIYKVLVLYTDRINLQNEGYVQDLYFLEYNGKYYKIIIKYFQYAFNNLFYLSGLRHEEVCKIAKLYNMNTLPFNHIKFWKRKCNNRKLEVTDGICTI